MEYVRRQALVREALKHLRPDLIVEIFESATPQEQVEMREEYSRQPSTGYWGQHNEWKYFLHGIGCRLTNVETMERIEWDVGDLQRFDRFWFLNYLEWLLGTNTMDEDISLIRSELDKHTLESRQSYSRNRLIGEIYTPILEELVELGLLIRDGQGYTLLESDSGTS